MDMNASTDCMIFSNMVVHYDWHETGTLTHEKLQENIQTETIKQFGFNAMSVDTTISYDRIDYTIYVDPTVYMFLTMQYTKNLTRILLGIMDQAVNGEYYEKRYNG